MSKKHANCQEARKINAFSLFAQKKRYHAFFSVIIRGITLTFKILLKSIKLKCFTLTLTVKAKLK